MTLEVKATVKNCRQCLHHDGESIRAPLVPIEAMGPMDLLHLDFTKIEVSGDHEKELKKKTQNSERACGYRPLYLSHHGLRDRRYDCSYCGLHIVPSLLLHL